MDTTQLNPAPESLTLARLEHSSEPGIGHPILDRAVLCADGLHRCPWALNNAAILTDHDHCWGQLPASSRAWFEALAMEIFQAGLAAGTALSRHGALREAFCGFHPGQVALLEDDDVDEFLVDRRLIRNRAKVEAVILAARVLQGWDTEDWEEMTNAAGHGDPQPARDLSQRLRALGVVHVGDGIARCFLVRTGRSPAHVPGCFRNP